MPETPHQYEEREAWEDRRDKMDEKRRRFLPQKEIIPRTSIEILADARRACSEDAEPLQVRFVMCGYLARQIEILERERAHLARQVLDMEGERDA